jgi:hypothetical protein
MSAGFMVVKEIILQHPLEMLFIEDNRMIQTFSAN